MNTPRLIPLALFALLTLALTGCGGGGDGIVAWDYTLYGENGNTILDTKQIDIVFEGVPFEERSEGSLQIGGPGMSQKQVTLGDQTFSIDYANNTATITYAGQTVRIVGSGQQVIVNEVTYDLEGEEARIIVGEDGKTRIIPD